MLGVVVLLPLLWFVSVYNGVQRARVRAENAFSQIDVQLRRRFDLIPNLVEAVKGYMAHERETLQAVIAARTSAQARLDARRGNAGDPSAAAALDSAVRQVDSALARLMAVTEAYPALKADQNTLALQEELTATENRVAFARQAFNDSVMVFNERIAVFPSNLVASLFKFQPLTPFLANDGERALPSVSFSRPA